MKIGDFLAHKELMQAGGPGSGPHPGGGGKANGKFPSHGGKTAEQVEANLKGKIAKAYSDTANQNPGNAKGAHPSDVEDAKTAHSKAAGAHRDARDAYARAGNAAKAQDHDRQTLIHHYQTAHPGVLPGSHITDRKAHSYSAPVL